MDKGEIYSKLHALSHEGVDIDFMIGSLCDYFDSSVLTGFVEHLIKETNPDEDDEDDDDYNG